MANLFNYKSKADYAAATDRPASQSSVSYAGSEIINDGKNVILPLTEANCEVGDMAVFDTIEGKRKILKSKTYHAGTFESSRYILSKGVYFGSQNGKAVFVAVENASASSKMWAEKCYFRLTGLDLTQAGSITFKTYYSWAAYNNNVVSWEAGATLASVVATINGLGLNASYFKAAVLADNTGIGIWVNYPTNNTIASIFSVTASTGGGTAAAVEYMNKYNGNDVVWQYVESSTIIPGRVKAASVRRRNGLVTSWGGAHFEKFVDYYKTNGSATFKPESDASPMNKACFDGLASSEVAAELAVYNKYGGDYSKYMKGAMCANPCAYGAIGLSYDDAAKQTALLGQVMTKDFDNNVIPAFPAAYEAYHYGVNAGVATGFEAGKWGLPTAAQMMDVIGKVGLNSSNKTDLNLAIDKYNAAGNFYGSGYYLWTCAEYSATYSFFYYGLNGIFYINSKYNTYSCRPVLALDLD